MIYIYINNLYNMVEYNGTNNDMLFIMMFYYTGLRNTYKEF